MRPADLNKASKPHRLDVKDVIAAWVRERGRRGLEPEGSTAPPRVISIDEAAQRAGTTRRNLERLHAAGQGPAVIQVSARKIGILESDFVEWLQSRRRPAPGKADEPEGPNV
jgi:hypothetical protein